MSKDKPDIPEFDEPKTASKSGHSAGSNKDWEWDKKKIFAVLAVLIAIILPVTGYFVYTRTQTTSSEAAAIPPGCPVSSTMNLNGRQCGGIVLEDGTDCGIYVYIECSRENNRGTCVLQGHTFDVGVCKDRCKRFGPCTEKCRLSNGQEVVNNTCGGDPSPTVTEKQICQAPNECVNQATALSRGCAATSTDANTQTCPLSSNAAEVGFCCPPAEEPKCEPPKQCIFPTDGSTNPEDYCKTGTIDKAASASCTDPSGVRQGVCCEPPDSPTPTPPPTSTPEPSVTPTATPTPPQSTMTPPVTQACVLPVIDVTVECAVCDQITQ